MSVVLRCPNCGTTRAAAGECEACHEAQVRYFCANHTPGLWLDGARCPKCGAAFGATLPAPAAPVVDSRSVAVRPAARASSSPPGTATAGARDTRPDGMAVRRSSDRREAEEAEEPAEAPGIAPWQLLLSNLLRDRVLTRTPRSGMSRGAPIAGCLRRVIILVCLVVFALAVVMFLVGRAVLRNY
jgi:hypothetical protein